MGHAGAGGLADCCSELPSRELAVGGGKLTAPGGHTFRARCCIHTQATSSGAAPGPSLSPAETLALPHLPEGGLLYRVVFAPATPRPGHNAFRPVRGLGLLPSCPLSFTGIRPAGHSECSPPYSCLSTQSFTSMAPVSLLHG